MLHGYDNVCDISEAESINRMEKYIEKHTQDGSVKTQNTDTKSRQRSTNNKDYLETTVLNQNEINVSEEQLKNTYNHDNPSIINITTNFDDIINSIIRLSKSNEQFKLLLIFFGIWGILTIAELFLGYTESLEAVMSDSFFNFFKIFAFLITLSAIYVNKFFNFRIKLLYERIELIAGLTNIIFLMITTFLMFIKALNILTEDDELHSSSFGHSKEESTISSFKIFCLLKLVLNLTCLLAFSDYILHPVLQIKIYLLKKYKKWILNLSEISESELKETSGILKIWNNHFVNMNCLMINILADLISSLLFLFGFFLSGDNHFEYIFFFISLVNFLIVVFMIYLFATYIVNLLMQGKSEILEPIERIIQREIGLFEGCLGIKEIKFWMVSNNSAKCQLKIFASKELDDFALRDKVEEIKKSCYIDIQILLDISY